MDNTLHQKILRPLWFFLAVVFLFEAWLWDLLGQGLARLAALIPFEAFKRALAATIARLPAPVVLLVFLIPLGVIEPFKFLGLWLIAHHHLIYGILAFIAAKVAGLGVMAFLFEMTRAKLLSMPWFERFYLFVLRIRAQAHAFVEPYKRKVREAMAPIKAQLQSWRDALRLALGNESGGLGRRLASLRHWARRSRGLT